MSDGLTSSLLYVGYVVAFLFFWLALVRVTATFGGWAKFARHYAAEEVMQGERFRFASARFGWTTSYSSSLFVTVSHQGFHMQPFIVFRYGHVPLFIPWEAVSELKRRRFVFFSSTRLSIDNIDDTTKSNIYFYGRALGDSLENHAPHRLVRN